MGSIGSSTPQPSFYEGGPKHESADEKIAKKGHGHDGSATQHGVQSHEHATAQTKTEVAKTEVAKSELEKKEAAKADKAATKDSITKGAGGKQQPATVNQNGLVQTSSGKVYSLNSKTPAFTGTIKDDSGSQEGFDDPGSPTGETTKTTGSTSGTPASNVSGGTPAHKTPTVNTPTHIPGTPGGGKIKTVVSGDQGPSAILTHPDNPWFSVNFLAAFDAIMAQVARTESNIQQQQAEQTRETNKAEVSVVLAQQISGIEQTTEAEKEGYTIDAVEAGLDAGVQIAAGLTTLASEYIPSKGEKAASAKSSQASQEEENAGNELETAKGRNQALKDTKTTTKTLLDKQDNELTALTNKKTETANKILNNKTELDNLNSKQNLSGTEQARKAQLETENSQLTSDYQITDNNIQAKKAEIQTTRNKLSTVDQNIANSDQEVSDKTAKYDAASKKAERAQTHLDQARSSKTRIWTAFIDMGKAGATGAVKVACSLGKMTVADHKKQGQITSAQAETARNLIEKFSSASNDQSSSARQQFDAVINMQKDVDGKWSQSMHIGS